ncbi:MAG: hypothetical protein AB9869_00575 [Verrucomicrobiia bacterium]
MNKHLGRILAVLLPGVIAGMPVCAANLVLNGNFEDGIQNPTWPHYGSSDEFPITAWNWAGGIGLNDETGPFWDGAVKVEQMSGKYVAFKQGAGVFSQDIDGFVGGQVYTLRFLERRRNCCGTPLLPANLIVRVGGEEIVAEHPLPVDQFTQVTQDFTANADGYLTLEFEMTAPEGGDNSMLLDAVSIVPKGEADPYTLNKPVAGVENPGWPVNAVKLSAGQTITIDGKVSAEEYKGAQPMVFNKNTLVNVPDPYFPDLNHNGKIQAKDSLTNTSLDDYTGTYYFMWDDQFFYAGLSAKDDSYGFAGPDPNGSDCLQFVFAVNLGDASASMYIPTIAPAGPDGEVLGKNAFGSWIEEDIMPASTYAGVVQDTGSWAVEIKIPWNSMTQFAKPIFPPKAGDSVGFSVLSIDYDVNDVGVANLEWFACNHSTFPWEGVGVEKLTFINAADATPPKLSAIRRGDAVNIEWGGVGQLQSAPAPGGPWSAITNPANPYVPTLDTAEFFRVKVQ